MNRRTFVKRTFWGSIGAGALAGLYTWQVEPFWLEFVHKKMPIAHLPNHLIGKTLMQISDIHVGNRFDYGYIIDSFKEAQKLRPDIVVYTGDYVSYEDTTQFEQLQEVLGYAVKGSLGTVAILGNHDYGVNWAQQEVGDQITAQLNSAGLKVLSNDQTEIEGLNIIGFDDFWGPNFFPEKVMKDYDASKANLVLNHNPDACDQDIWNGYEGWILSGHTHGGQCKPPFLPPPIIPVRNKKYTQGEFLLSNNRTLYINRALGHTFQLRFNVRPEITVFELART